MILGSNYDAPIHELLNDNSCERKVVDLCTGAGHWYVVLLSQTHSVVERNTPTADFPAADDNFFQGTGDGRGVSPRRVPWA
jgi:hypothetical protein